MTLDGSMSDLCCKQSAGWYELNWAECPSVVPSTGRTLVGLEVHQVSDPLSTLEWPDSWILRGTPHSHCQLQSFILILYVPWHWEKNEVLGDRRQIKCIWEKFFWRLAEMDRREILFKVFVWIFSTGRFSVFLCAYKRKGEKGRKGGREMKEEREEKCKRRRGEERSKSPVGS